MVTFAKAAPARPVVVPICASGTTQGPVDSRALGVDSPEFGHKPAQEEQDEQEEQDAEMTRLVKKDPAVRQEQPPTVAAVGGAVEVHAAHCTAYGVLADGLSSVLPILMAPPERSRRVDPAIRTFLLAPPTLSAYAEPICSKKQPSNTTPLLLVTSTAPIGSPPAAHTPLCDGTYPPGSEGWRHELWRNVTPVQETLAALWTSRRRSIVGAHNSLVGGAICVLFVGV